MTFRSTIVSILATAVFGPHFATQSAHACCPAPPNNRPVVNADQTVIIIWDTAAKTQHFIRQASFKSKADDFGFLVPSPAEPELAESGQQVFSLLAELTKPDTIEMTRPSGVGCGCSASKSAGKNESVRVLQDKLVAGFHAAVLDASSASALVGWLKDHGYAYSPEVREWAEPYIKAGWKITALKVVKDKAAGPDSTVNASALRMSFKTDKPLFPYREPRSGSAAEQLAAHDRLLRIYLIADARFKGHFSNGVDWPARIAWADHLKDADRDRLLEALELPASTGPAQWYLTEFEHHWPYADAPGDVDFQRDPTQDTVKRQPWIKYVSKPGPGDVVACSLLAALLLPRLLGRRRDAS